MKFCSILFLKSFLAVSIPSKEHPAFGVLGKTVWLLQVIPGGGLIFGFRPRFWRTKHFWVGRNGAGCCRRIWWIRGWNPRNPKAASQRFSKWWPSRCPLNPPNLRNWNLCWPQEHHQEPARKSPKSTPKYLNLHPSKYWVGTLGAPNSPPKFHQVDSSGRRFHGRALGDESQGFGVLQKNCQRGVEAPACPNLELGT